jgi:hypothetical protein
MKILPLIRSATSVESPRKKQDGGGDGREAYQRQKKTEKDHPQERDPEQFERALSDAREEMERESSAVIPGLKTEVQGEGPGLRVVLKNADGSVIGQYSGEDFLELRSRVKDVTLKSGRLLDRKV